MFFSTMDKSKKPYKRIKCARKGCGRCLFCLQLSGDCTCTQEDKIGEPKDVLYGWCKKCRISHKRMYSRIEGINCTYCGGDVEPEFTTTGLISACLLFPIGLLICCYFKQKRCVDCTREVL